MDRAEGFGSGGSMAQGEANLKPPEWRHRKEGRSDRYLRPLEEEMRFMGTVFLTGAAVIVLWKVMAALFFGILGLALKVGLVVAVGYFLLKIFNGNKKQEKEAEA